MGATRFSPLDVVLSWTRDTAGRTAVLQYVAGQGWVELGRTDGTEWTARNLEPERRYSFAAAGVHPEGSIDPESEWEKLDVVPLATADAPAPPSTPAGFAAAQDGAILNLRWDAATDGVTQTYEIRVGGTWEDGQLVAEGLTGSPYTWAWRASGAQTLFLKGIDRYGRACRVAASIDVTVAALETHVTTDTADEAGAAWPGTATHLEDDGAGALRHEALPAHFGAWTDPFGSYAVPCFAKYWPVGIYQTPEFNAGQVEPHRIEVDLGASQPVDADLPFGAVHRPAIGADSTTQGDYVRPGTRPWASRQSWRLTPLDAVDILAEIDTSQSAAGAWEGWRPWVPGTYVAWRTRLRITARGDGLRFVKIPRLVVRRRKFNWKDEGSVTLDGVAPVEVSFAAAFTAAPVVVAQLVGTSSARRVDVTSIDATKCYLEAFDAAGTSVAATVGWHAMGP